MTPLYVWPEPPEGTPGESCPICGAPVDDVTVVAELPSGGVLSMPSCANGHNLMPAGWRNRLGITVLE